MIGEGNRTMISSFKPWRALTAVAPILVAAMHMGYAAQGNALELNRYFSSDMVLQRDKPLTVWGTAKKDATVTVTFSDQTKSGKADESGKWHVTLAPMKTNRTGQDLKVVSTLDPRLPAEALAKEGPTTLSNVVVGDVFLFARQSSIDVSLGTTAEGRKAAAELTANNACRFIRIKTSPSGTPLDNLGRQGTEGWQVVDKKSALAMSAALFYLGRDLAAEVDVPIGIVDLHMGYHFAGAWLSKEGQEKAQTIPGEGAKLLKVECEYLSKDMAAWDKGVSDYVRDYRTNLKHRPQKYDGPLRGASPIEMPHAPSVCYNAVIHPLRGLVLKGMLLQLGNDYPWVIFKRLRKHGRMTDREEITHAAQQIYPIVKEGKQITPQVLTPVANDLRESLGDASLPVAWIMPPGSDKYEYATMNRDVRELQRRIQAESKAIDLILPGAGNIRMSGQPADEALLAGRCKQWVLSTFYDAKGPSSGPLLDRVEFENGVGTIFFKPGTARGLSADGEALKHFEVAGADREFFPCNAEVAGSTIKLSCKDVPTMAMVRYGWTRRPVQGLVNSAGLPALPFNTDPKWEYNYFPALSPVAKSDESDTRADIAIITAKRHGEKVPETPVVLFGDATMLNHGKGPAKYPENQWQRWRLTVVEVPAHAPEGWEKPQCDDAGWDEVVLPTAWPSGHVGLLRTTFEVKDELTYESLTIRCGFYKIRNFKVYLNGHLVAIVNAESRALGASVPLTPYALKQLKKGKNHLAVMVDHGRRHVKFGFRLEGRLKADLKGAR